MHVHAFVCVCGGGGGACMGASEPEGAKNGLACIHIDAPCMCVYFSVVRLLTMFTCHHVFTCHRHRGNYNNVGTPEHGTVDKHGQHDESVTEEGTHQPTNSPACSHTKLIVQATNQAATKSMYAINNLSTLFAPNPPTNPYQPTNQPTKPNIHTAQLLR